MKGSFLIGEGDQSVVGDGYAMGVTAQIAEHVLWSSERSFRIDHPVLSKEWSQPGEEGFRLSEGLQVSMKVELAVLEGALECRNELAAKNATEHLNGKKEGVASLDPVQAIGRQPTTRDNTMHMRVQLEFLIPGVQHAEETGLRAEMFGIASDFEERFRTGSEQEIVDDLFVLQSQRG